MCGHQHLVVGVLVGVLALTAAPARAQAVQGQPRPAAASFYTTPLAPADMRNKEAVVETSAGTFVIQLLPDAAPNHVGYFIKLAREGAYTGTTFHRVVKDGIVQGGDPISTAFGRVVDGMAVVEAIERVPVNGESPVARVEVVRVKVVRVPH